ncbi:MAG: PaaI family thioesterase [Thermoplasmatota archaeon]
MNIPFDDFMGFARTVRGPGDVMVVADVDARHHNPMGVVHGGVLMGLMDSAMGASMTSLLEPGERTTNSEMQVRLVAPVEAGELVATAQRLHETARTILWEATVTHEGRIVARATSTFIRMK